MHYLVGLGSAEVLPLELQGALYDPAGSPNDPLFIFHHLMLDCILQEWLKRHPNSGYPVHPMVRDGHRKDDYIRTFFPLITNEEAFASAEQFGYYCKLPNIGLTEPKGKIMSLYNIMCSLSFRYTVPEFQSLIISYTAPSPLETTFSFRMSGDSVDVCVETKEAKAFKLVLRDTNKKRYVREG